MFKITVDANQAYYEEAYSELISSKKLKKWEPYFATAMIFFGVLLYWMDEKRVIGIVPFIIAAIGTYELFSVYYSRYKWLNDRSKSGISGQQLELQFDDNKITHTGPFSKGEIIWSGINKATLTAKGLVLSPENGVSMYLPKAAFQSSEQMDYVLAKVNKYHG